jgi:hypothetical protein
VSWYTWLEQGRDIHVSDAVLDSITACLQLDATQREYLDCLAHGRSAEQDDCREVACLPPSVQRVLEAHGPSPGYAINERFEIIGWNQTARAVFGDFSTLPAWVIYQAASSYRLTAWMVTVALPCSRLYRSRSGMVRDGGT